MSSASSLLFPAASITALVLLSVATTYCLIINERHTEDAGQFQKIQNVTEETSESTDTELETTTSLTAVAQLPENANYYFSDISHTWEDAQTYCRSMSRTSKLAEFHSKKDLRKASMYVMRHTSGGEFWIGGIYKRQRWEWTQGGLVDEPIASWQSPGQQFSRNSRLAIYIADRYTVYWSISPKVDRKRFLCQV